MGTVVQLKNQINDSYFQLKDSVEEKLVLTEEKIKSKTISIILEIDTSQPCKKKNLRQIAIPKSKDKFQFYAL